MAELPEMILVELERAGPGSLWHSWCFTCITCNVTLANFLYYYSEGHLYCGRYVVCS